ncbi:MAG: hypothetical protein RSB67_00095 [Clostridia bacterium]
MTSEEFDKKVKLVNKNFEIIEKCDKKQKELEKVFLYIDEKEGK